MILYSFLNHCLNVNCWNFKIKGRSKTVHELIYCIFIASMFCFDTVVCFFRFQCVNISLYQVCKYLLRWFTCKIMSFWISTSNNLSEYRISGVFQARGHSYCSLLLQRLQQAIAKAHLQLRPSFFFMITVFIAEECVFLYAITDKRECACRYVLARHSVTPVIWPFGPLVRRAKHSRNISLKWTSSDVSVCDLVISLYGAVQQLQQKGG